MASPDGQPTRLARIKSFVLSPVLSCCGTRKKPARPLEIQPPKDFRRMEIRLDGLTPEQEAFLREKAFLDTLPPTPPLPILSPPLSGSPTLPTTPSTTAGTPTNPLFFSHSNASCFFSQQHHHHHLDYDDYQHTASTKPKNTYTSCSAPHLSTTTTLDSTLAGATDAHDHHHDHRHHHHKYQPYSVPHLPTAAAASSYSSSAFAFATSPPFSRTNTMTTMTTSTTTNGGGGGYYSGGSVRRQSRRFSAINLLRGSWNNSHPVSPEEAAMTTSPITTPAPASLQQQQQQQQRRRRTRRLRRLSGVSAGVAGSGGDQAEMMEERRRGKFVGQELLEWEKGGGRGCCGGADHGEVVGGCGGKEEGDESEAKLSDDGGSEAKSAKSVGRDSEVTLSGPGCGCGGGGGAEK